MYLVWVDIYRQRIAHGLERDLPPNKGEWQLACATKSKESYLEEVARWGDYINN